MVVSPVTKGVLCAFLATLIWSGNFIVSRLLAADIPPVTLAVVRWLFSLFFLLAIAKNHFRIIFFHIRDYWGYLLLAACLGIACFNTFIYIAGHTSNAINMALLASTSPIFTWLFIWLFKIDTVRWKNVAAILVAIIGVLFIVSGGDVQRLLNLTFNAGDFWAVGAALSFAAYSVLLRFMPKTLPYTAFLVIVIVFGLIMLLPFMALEYANGAVFIWHNKYIWLILYMTLGMTVIAYLLWIKAVVLIGPGNSSMIYYSLPVMTALEAVCWLGEKISFYHILGALFIVAAIVITILGNKSANS